MCAPKSPIPDAGWLTLRSQRRRTLLPELHRRNKVGGIVDRRIGENDPTMTPEERAMERFTREKQRKKGASLFDLEETSDEERLTHLGQTLPFGGADANGVDDFDSGSVEQSSEDDDDERLLRKRRRGSFDLENGAPDPAEDEQPERKKTSTLR